MPRINSGILHNASPLTAEQIKLIEQQAVEMNTPIVYLDENGKTCFTTNAGADAIKKLAWHNCSSIERADNATLRRDFKKTGLEAFKTTDFRYKYDDSDSWISCYQEPLHITGTDGKIPSGFTIFHCTSSETDYVPLVLYPGDQLPQLLPGDVIAHNYVGDNGPATVVYAVLSNGGYNDLDGARAAILTTLRADYIKDLSFDLEEAARLPWTYFNDHYLGAESLDEFFDFFDQEAYGNQQLICRVIAVRDVVDTVPKLASSVFGLTVAAFGLDSMMTMDPISYEPFNVILPSSVVDVASTTFVGSAVDTVTTLREGAFNINSYSFAETGIDRFLAPFSTVNVTSGAFENSQLQELYCPKGVSTIDDFAFAYTPIRSIKLNNNMRYIGENAFEGCYNLESIELPDSLETIGFAAFCNSNLRHITIPESVTYISDYAFADCYQLESATIKGQLIQIPNQLFAYTGLREVVLPSSVRRIHYGAFESTLISEITIPSGVEYIDEGAFGGCSELQTVDFASCPAAIFGAFRGCYNLSSIRGAENLLHIDSEAFADCSALRELTLGSCLCSIGVSAFAHSGLERIDLSKSPIGWIGTDAFYGTNIQSIDLSNAFECQIAEYAFDDCDCLHSVTLGTGVWSLGPCVFSGCTSLGSINYLGTVRAWQDLLANSDATWYDNSNISYVQCADGTVDLDGNPISLWTVPENCTYQQFISSEENSIEYPAGTIVPDAPSLHDCFFDGELAYEYIDEDNTSVKAGWNISAYMSDRSEYQIRTEINNAPVVSIGPGAFRGSKIASLVIPDSIVVIYDEAFTDCRYLGTDITFAGTKQQWYNIVDHNPDWYSGSSIRFVQCSDGSLRPDGSPTGGTWGGGGSN